MDVSRLSAAVKSAGNARFVDAWLAWRSDRLLPDRSAVDLRYVAADLPTIGVIEVRSPDEIVARIAGSALRQHHGTEMTGRSLREITTDADWPVRSGRYLQMTRQPCGSFYQGRDVLPTGQVMEYEVVQLALLPGAPDEPRQIIWNVMPLDQSFVLEPPTGPRTVPVSSRYVFVDIGASLPGAATP